jgi:plasmid maintenance system antidote protein VapI
LRLAKYFGLSDEYFVKLQMQFEIDTARQKDQKSISKIIKFEPKRNKPAGCVEQLEAQHASVFLTNTPVNRVRLD